MEMTSILILLLVVTLGLSLVTVQQGMVAVTTIFGKYSRTLYPGLNLRIPFIERIFKRISIQNRAVEMSFQAVTVDQANVHFTSLLLFAVMDNAEPTIQKVAFRFVSDKDFMATLSRTGEGRIRAYVAAIKQAEMRW